MNSLWSETVSLPAFPQLMGDAETDVLIIGGGMAGILCAHFLREAGVAYLLAEGGVIGGGITKNTTAKITAQHGLLYHKLLKSAGEERAGKYLAANQQAVADYRGLCAGIDCDFEEQDAYVYSLRDRGVIEKEVSALRRLGCNAAFADGLPLPFAIAGAVRFPGQAQFHPLKFLAAIAKGLNIHARTYVKELAPGKAVTARGTIRAKHIIVATHFPFLNRHGGCFLKLYQRRSYVIALENAAEAGGMYLEEKRGGLSFRNHGGLLLVGGGGHKTGAKGGNWQALRAFAARAYPNAREAFAWAAQDCMTLDGVPYIGHYGGSARGLYVAAGFNKWGMTSSMAAARLLTDLVLGRGSEYAEVFSPQRGMCKPRLLVNGLNAAANLLTPSLKRCPHMGCALKWNPAERSWDCPCHGSRFDEGGALLDNPATRGLNSRPS